MKASSGERVDYTQFKEFLATHKTTDAVEKELLLDRMAKNGM